MKARENDSEMSDEEEDDGNSYRRKDAEKDLKCVTNGIEKKKAVEMVSEKQRIKRGKVRVDWCTHRHKLRYNINMMRIRLLNHYSMVDDSF